MAKPGRGGIVLPSRKSKPSPAKAAIKPVAKKPTLGGKSSGKGGGGKDPYSQMLADQKAQQAKADRAQTDQSRAALTRTNAAMRVEKNLVNSKKIELSKDGWAKARDTKLGNITRGLRQGDGLILDNFSTELSSLRSSLKGDETHAADQSQAALNNAARESSGAQAEATLHGAGESDLLQTQNIALRNWNVNTSETRQNYNDALLQTNAAVVELNNSTRNARFDLYTSANNERAQAHQEYLNNQRNSLIDRANSLGKLYGGEMDKSAILKTRDVGTYSPKKAKAARGRAMDYNKQQRADLNRASQMTGRAWKDSGISAPVQNWKGAGAEKSAIREDKIGAGVAGGPRKAPEGATLRKWEGNQ